MTEGGASHPSKPGPVLEGLTGEWYDLLARDELSFQRCRRCARWRHPPRVACATCRADTWAWERSPGRGVIHSWTVSHQALHPAWAPDVPYAIVVAALEEPGVRLVAGWSGPLEALRLDLPVVVDREEREDGLVVPRLGPAA
ncbi:MAG: Zn-ribbon domain-containing OB-fold protein [Acidimicrobiales bacterium]